MLGHKSVRDAQRHVASDEFVEWLAYFRLVDARPDPRDQRADWRHAEQLTLLANINRDRKRRPSPFRVEEFLPRWDGSDDPGTTEEQLLAKIVAINAALDGRVRVH